MKYEAPKAVKVEFPAALAAELMPYWDAYLIPCGLLDCTVLGRVLLCHFVNLNYFWKKIMREVG